MMTNNARLKGNVRINTFHHFIKILSILVVVVLFLVPIVRLILLSFQTDNGIGLHLYKGILSDPITWITMKNTLIVVGGSTILSVLLGVIVAWLMAYTNIRFKKLMYVFILLPMIIPSYITTLAWTQFLGPTSVVSKWIELLPGNIEPFNLYSLTGMVLVMGISHYPLVFLLTTGVLKRIPRELEMAARASGVTPVQSFFKITIPLALPGLASGGLLAFLASLDNFGIPAFLGIPSNIKVLSTYIYEQMIGFGPSAFAKGAVLSVLLGIVAMVGTIIQWLLLVKSRQFETAKEDHEPRVRFKKKTMVLIGLFVWSFLLITSVIPLLSMGATSLIKAYGLEFSLQNISLKNYDFVLLSSPKTHNAILNSMKLSVIITVICLFVGTWVAYARVRRPSTMNKLLEIIIGLPYALPGTVLALAMIFAWMEPIPGWNPGIYGTIWILLIAYFARFLILQIRGSATSLMQVDVSVEEAARVSGADLFTKWKKVLIPLITPGIVGGAFLVFLSALTELTVSSLLWSSGTETIGLVIFNFEQAGYTTYSTAFSTVIVVLIILGMALGSLLQVFWNRKVIRHDHSN